MWSNLLLIIMLGICVVTDIRQRKIYNAVLIERFSGGERTSSEKKRIKSAKAGMAV